VEVKEKENVKGVDTRDLQNLKADESRSAVVNAEEIGKAQAFYSIPELARRWRCSRGSVYNRIRGERILDFATKGGRGHKVVPHEVVSNIERRHMRILR
jgi:hypothetical protein